ncbi:hypothetical protein F2Q68_00022752 [Brassica cretica]|uniref:Uncharacterized protein n=1 Tax=Brassica cretica TaxID=69181 RepID=A0A8S9FYS5_BRACR|nr:hypothetical protein F2Q68_00022752 [Brassica cretica]
MGTLTESYCNKGLTGWWHQGWWRLYKELDSGQILNLSFENEDEELYIGEEDGLHQRDRKLVTSSYWVVSLPVKDSAWKHSFDTPVYRELKSFIDSIEN